MIARGYGQPHCHQCVINDQINRHNVTGCHMFDCELNDDGLGLCVVKAYGFDRLDP